jgi:hypothetical protein
MRVLLAPHSDNAQHGITHQRLNAGRAAPTKRKEVDMARLTFFHGGVSGLEIGTHLLPPTETGWEETAGIREDRVYVTTSLMQAVCCARLEHGWVYLVRPIGGLGPDDNGERGPNYTARRALILNRAALPQRMLDFTYGTDFDAFHADMIDLELTLTGRWPKKFLESKMKLHLTVRGDPIFPRQAAE